MESRMSQNPHAISRAGSVISRLFMRVMFRPVQGWKQAVPERATAFVEHAADGSRLEGALRLAHGQPPRGVVLLCHPFLKYGMHYFFESRLDDAFAGHGFHVVSFNFKGFGRSTISGHAFADDVLAIARRIRREHPGLPLHLLGCSFGGYHASHALARDASLFSSVVLDSVPVSVRSYFRRGLLSIAMRWISGSGLARATGTCAIDQSLGQVTARLPIAYLHGTRDRYIDDTSIAELAHACPRMEFFDFDGCGHLEGHKKLRDRYLAVALDVFARATPASRLSTT